MCGSVALASLAQADTISFNFAPVGTSYSAVLLPGNPAVGGRITTARIYLNVEIFSGGKAQDFEADIAFPIEPDPGNTNALIVTGAGLGWSGAGVFNHLKETTEFNGTFKSVKFGAETFPIKGQILEGSRIEFDYDPVPPCGDLNGDGLVDQQDLGILLGDWGCAAGPGLCPGDADGDGDTDQADLGVLLANFGLACP